MLRIETPRLQLTAATALLARADVADPAGFAAVLDADVPASWPPQDLVDVREYFAAQLEKGFAVPGWWHWYAALKTTRPGGKSLLMGTGGFAGKPDDMGVVTLGYGLLPEFAGRGYASEIAGALMNWAIQAGPVTTFVATTFEFHHGSIRVLEKNGFSCRGVSSEDAAASAADRQGRGRLMRYVREITI